MIGGCKRPSLTLRIRFKHTDGVFSKYAKGLSYVCNTDRTADVASHARKSSHIFHPDLVVRSDESIASDARRSRDMIKPPGGPHSGVEDRPSTKPGNPSARSLAIGFCSWAQQQTILNQQTLTTTISHQDHGSNAAFNATFSFLSSARRY